MLELMAKSLTQDNPMDSIQVGKAVFVKESYTTLGIEPRTYSNRFLFTCVFNGLENEQTCSHPTLLALPSRVNNLGSESEQRAC